MQNKVIPAGKKNMGIGRWSRNEVHDPVKLAEASKVPSPFGARTCGQVLDTPLTCPHYSDGMRRKNTKGNISSMAQ